jgi:hypothetical protein
MPEGTIQVKPQELPEPTWAKDWVECVPQPGENQRIVLWEGHAQHPTGEAFLAPGPARFVALTPEVSRLIRDGVLRIVEEPEETLEEWLHKTGQHPDTPGDYHHIARAKPRAERVLAPRPKPSARK